MSKWWSFTNLKKSKYDDRSLRTRTVACHLSLNYDQIYTDHSWTIEDEDPHLDTTWLGFRETPATNTVVPSEYMKKNWPWENHKLSHGSTINFFTKNQSLLCDFSVHYECILYSTYIYTYIFSKSNPKQEENNLPSFQKPTSPCNSHSPTAVSPWGALMQSIKGIPLHLGIGAITPVKASDEQVSVAVRGDWNVFNPILGSLSDNPKW